MLLFEAFGNTQGVGGGRHVKGKSDLEQELQLYHLAVFFFEFNEQEVLVQDFPQSVAPNKVLHLTQDYYYFHRNFGYAQTLC